MNLKNKALAILLVLIFCISLLPAVSAVDYSIPYANVDIQVYDDGLINVYEEIDYHFDSSANGVYRDIPLKRNQSVENLHVYVEGAYSVALFHAREMLAIDRNVRNLERILFFYNIPENWYKEFNATA